MTHDPGARRRRSDEHSDDRRVVGLGARNEFEVGPGGQFLVARTIASDNGGEPYERSRTIDTWDREQEVIVAHGFASHGSVTVQAMDHELTDEGTLVLEMRREAEPGSGVPTLDQRLEIAQDAEAYSWKVWFEMGGGQRVLVMDDEWELAKK